MITEYTCMAPTELSVASARVHVLIAIWWRDVFDDDLVAAHLGVDAELSQRVETLGGDATQLEVGHQRLILAVLLQHVPHRQHRPLGDDCAQQVKVIT